jgi:predicted nucleic acid-binding protein
MKYVLDSSVAFKWLVLEKDTAKALRLRDDYRNQVIELLAPDIFPVETVHSLTRAQRLGRVTSQQGVSLFQDFLRHLPRMHPCLPLLPRAYALSSQARIGVYDCVYVALAEREGCEFITADDKLVKNLQGQFPFIVPLASMP